MPSESFWLKNKSHNNDDAVVEILLCKNLVFFFS